jgi:hypothetical protein
MVHERHEPNQSHVVLPRRATSPPCAHVVFGAPLLSPVGLEGPSSRSWPRIMRQRTKAGHGGKPATAREDWKRSTTTAIVMLGTTRRLEEEMAWYGSSLYREATSR